MSVISEYINKKNDKDEKILSVFLTSGFPNTFNFPKLALDVLNSGADMLEIGFPFSDPLADGPIIQESSQKSLANNINLEKTFEYTASIRKETDKPLILMGYANPVLAYGTDKFAADLKISGANGVIIPDVPIEEYDLFFTPEFKGIDITLLIAPTTSDKRVKVIDEKSSGFVYCVSMRGTTGNFISASDNINFIKNTYSLVKKNKMLVGFGISTPQIAKEYSQYCDGVIVGSAVIKSLMNANGTYNNTLDLVRSLKQPLIKF